jgi:hypothetical protein
MISCVRQDNKLTTRRAMFSLRHENTGSPSPEKISLQNAVEAGVAGNQIPEFAKLHPDQLNAAVRSSIRRFRSNRKNCIFGESRGPVRHLCGVPYLAVLNLF